MIDPADVEHVVDEVQGEFKITLWLSTDGKQTVQVEAETKEGRSVGIPYAKALYKKVLEEFGTKQAQAVKEYSGKKGFPNDSGPIAQEAQAGIPIHHGKPMTFGKWGWYCKTKLEDGSWCKYKPPKDTV